MVVEDKLSRCSIQTQWFINNVILAYRLHRYTILYSVCASSADGSKRRRPKYPISIYSIVFSLPFLFYSSLCACVRLEMRAFFSSLLLVVQCWLASGILVTSNNVRIFSSSSFTFWHPKKKLKNISLFIACKQIRIPSPGECELWDTYLISIFRTIQGDWKNPSRKIRLRTHKNVNGTAPLHENHNYKISEYSRLAHTFVAHQVRHIAKLNEQFL